MSVQIPSEPALDDPTDTHRMTLRDVPAEPDFSDVAEQVAEEYAASMPSASSLANDDDDANDGTPDTIAMAAVAAAERADSSPETIDDGWTTEGIPTPVVDDEDGSTKTKRTDDSATGRFNRIDDDLSDDEREFGRPGTTIPPEFLGAMPGAIDEATDGDGIPITTEPMEDASTAVPLMPLPEPAAAALSEPTHLTPADHRELEDSSLQLVQVLRELDRATARDAVMKMLLAHLAGSHQRVAFFAVTAGRLSPWRLSVSGGPLRKPPEKAGLSLDISSTFQDVVGTRLPFRGPLSDPVTQALVENVFGSDAAEMLCMPVAVRGRVVGVLYGDTPTRHVFEEHLAVVTRAAGVALERILKARKSG